MKLNNILVAVSFSERSIDAVRKAVEAGVTHVHIHQIGPEQGPFLEMAENDLLPSLRRD